MSKQAGFFPVRLSVVREYAEYQRERYPWAENIAYTIISTAESTMLPTKPRPWYTPNWNAIRDHVNSAVRLVQAGQAPAAIALQQVADPIQQLLDSGWDLMIPGRLLGYVIHPILLKHPVESYSRRGFNLTKSCMCTNKVLVLGF